MTMAQADRANLLGMAEAFTIMARYTDATYEFCAEHDEIWAGHSINMESVSEADMARLEELGWTPADVGGFHRYV